MTLPRAGATLSMPVRNYAIVLHGPWRCPEMLNMSATAAVFTRKFDEWLFPPNAKGNTKLWLLTTK